MTYRGLSAQAGRLANALQALGVVKGSRVMLLLPNVPQSVIAYYGALRLGAIVVMGNPLESREEIVREAQQTGAEVLVTLTKFEETAVAVKAQTNVRHIIFTNVKDYFPWTKFVLFSLRRERKGGHRLRQTVADRAIFLAATIAPTSAPAAASGRKTGGYGRYPIHQRHNRRPQGDHAVPS